MKLTQPGRAGALSTATADDQVVSVIPLDALPIPALVHELRRMKILSANRAAALLLGYSVAELRTLRLKDVLPEDEIALLRASVAATAASAEFRGPFHLRTKSGDSIEAEAIGAPIRLAGRTARLALVWTREPGRATPPVEAMRIHAGAAGRAPLLVWTTDSQLRLATSVRALAGGFLPQAHPVGTPVAEMFENVDGRDEALSAHRSALLGTPAEYQIDTGTRQYRCFVDALRDSGHEIVGVIGLAFEISEQVSLRHALSAATWTLQVAESSARVGTFELDIAAGTMTWSREMRRLLGVPSGEIVNGESFFRRVHPDDRPMLRRALREARKRCVAYRLEHRVVLEDDVRLWFETSAQPVAGDNGTVTRLHGAATDITARKNFEEQLAFLAHHDQLTGLPNRTLIAERLTTAIDAARRSGHPVGVIFLGVDDFKRINDVYGQAEGDRVIRVCAGRLGRCVEARDTVARVAGDEFVVLLADLDCTNGAAHTVECMQCALAEPIAVGNLEIRLRATFGISCFPSDGDSAEQLIGFADMAMFRAKQTRRGEFAYFEPGLHEAATDRLRLEHELRDAIRFDQLEVHYQAIIDARTKRVDGVEALVRWKHPVDGLVSPARFIPLAEDTGLIVPLGEFVLRKALAAVSALQRAGFAELRVAVNMSPRQLVDESVRGMVRSALAESGMPARLLDLEVTESYLVTDPQRAASLLEEFAGLGIRIALDDFGTGYSALSSLRQFPVHQLKLDRSFVTEVEQNATARAIAATIIDLAHTLNMRSLAEGVETAEQYAALDELGCEAFQGYHFARPMPFAALEEHLRAAGESPGG